MAIEPGLIQGPHRKPSAHHQQPWWKVMCLTGVDYFSTLGYQPGIAALAAGALSPVATLVLVCLTGEERFGYKILRVESATVGNTIAAVLLHIRDRTSQLPHVYFGWTKGNPVLHLLRYLIFGDGDVPPITREVLRKAEPVRERRPLVHIG